MAEDRFQILLKFGLTLYDVKVFQALLNGGSMTAQEIARYSHVPYPKVYSSLKKLSEIKWIKEEKSWPSKYYLASPDEILLRFKEKIDNDVKEFESFIESSVRPVYNSKGMTEKSDVWLVNGYKAVIETFLEAIKLAKEEVKIAIPFDPSQNLLVELRESTFKKQDLKIKVLTASRSSKNIKKFLPKAEVRARDFMFGGGVISDSRTVVLMLSMSEGDYTAIASNHPYLAMLADSYFNYLWEGAEAPF
ncbi:MAG: TrmB family transcriptional regulator [Nitrososphaeria archaeon]|nr:helix-turn-helix domain-containing protein [Conexivisphaerales archaeon]